MRHYHHSCLLCHLKAHKHGVNAASSHRGICKCENIHSSALKVLSLFYKPVILCIIRRVKLNSNNLVTAFKQLHEFIRSFLIHSYISSFRRIIAIHRFIPVRSFCPSCRHRITDTSAKFSDVCRLCSTASANDIHSICRYLLHVIAKVRCIIHKHHAVIHLFRITCIRKT